jgi:hypothetical protein
VWYKEKLPAPPGSAQSDFLGFAVALSDDATVLIATAPYRASQGTAFVYRRAASGAALTSAWAVNATLDPGAPPCFLSGSNRNFGKSLDTTPTGDVIIVGSPLGGAQRGAATIFERNDAAAGAPYTCTRLLRPSAAQDGDGVGTGVALSEDGNVAFVSGIRTVHVFSRTSRGAPWEETGALPSPFQQAFNEDFGASVRVGAAGAAALVGAPGSSPLSSAPNYAGYVSLFDRDGSGGASASATPSPPPTPSPTATATDSDTPSTTASLPPSPSKTPSADASASGTGTGTGSGTGSGTRTRTPTFLVPLPGGGGGGGNSGAGGSAGGSPQPAAPRGEEVFGFVAGALLMLGVAAGVVRFVSWKSAGERLSGKQQQVQMAGFAEPPPPPQQQQQALFAAPGAAVVVNNPLAIGV